LNVPDVPGALFDEEVISSRIQMDMNTKMREDPLFAIRRREVNERKKLLQNPVKMKQLQKNVSFVISHIVSLLIESTHCQMPDAQQVSALFFH
jgi:hypothetical protein